MFGSGSTRGNGFAQTALRFYPAGKFKWRMISRHSSNSGRKAEQLNPEFSNKSVKLVANCESFLFQRPDEAIIRGYDKEAKAILFKTIFSDQYEPLTHEDAVEPYEDAIRLDEYTEPVQELIKKVAAATKKCYFVTPSHPRVVDGVPTKNPRYLQRNLFKNENEESYLAEVGVRLHRRISHDKPVHFPVNSVLPGRRNNPAEREKGIRPLSVYNPIHYRNS